MSSVDLRVTIPSQLCHSTTISAIIHTFKTKRYAKSDDREERVREKRARRRARGKSET